MPENKEDKIMKTLACHQPEFLPYLGFWHKMRKSDVFVFLDNVQYQRRGVQNRNKISGDRWITVPIIRNWPEKINEVRINYDNPWNKSMADKIIETYKNSPYFEKHWTFFSNWIQHKWNHLELMNVSAIFYIAGHIMERDTKCVSLSCLENKHSISKDPTQRIIDVCKILKCDTYLSGQGGKRYLDESAFKKNGIELAYSEYNPPSHLSIIHYLFNHSMDEIREMIK